MDIVWNDVFALILTGMVVVFLALGFLTLVVMGIGKIASVLQKNAPKQIGTEHAEAAEAFSMAQTDTISPEVIAVISAAVAMMMAPNTTYHIAKINQVPAAWRTAGVMQNTRSF